MRVLTRIPGHLRDALAAADPAGDVEVDRPDVEALIARAESELPVDTITTSRPRRLRALAPAAVVAAVVLVAAAVVVFRHADSGDRPVRAGHGAVATDFPVTAKPRPIVLIGDPVSVGAFPSGDAKIAFMNGAIDVQAPYPSPLVSIDGYPMLPATEAIAQLTEARSCCATTSTRLRLTEISLTHHRFETDRGETSLPAWQIHFAGFAYDTYVLAVSAGGMYRDFRTSAGAATLSADGRRLTVPVVTHHRSTGRCDIGYRQTLASTQGTHGVRIVVHTTYDDVSSPAPGTNSTGASTGYGCDNIGHGVNRFVPPTPGAPDTRTIALDEPLGNRIVVDGSGRPYVVTR